MSKGKETELTNQSLTLRIFNRIKNVTDSWFPPLEAPKPIAPPQTAGRAFDYDVGYNLHIKPRHNQPSIFEDLRNLAQNCDILRSVIETRKDQLESLPWIIQPRLGLEDNPDNKSKISEVMNFLQYPDKEHDWTQWLRIIMEDIFVIDASAIYKQRNRKGDLYALQIIDGATISKKINDDGRRPLPPEPAYQQILKGLPAVNYTSEELLYLVRNPRSWTPYGYSPVEQIIVTVNVQLRRRFEQLTYYTSGNIPLGFGNLPKEYTDQQVIDFQRYFNAMREGNLDQRSQLVFMPGDFKYIPIKQTDLKNDFDEWLARIICYTFSVSPEPFLNKVNRATAQTSKDSATEEGIIPTQHFIKRVMDRIIAIDFNAPQLEFIWQNDKEYDAKTGSEIHVSYVKSGIMSIDEVRLDLGRTPLGGSYSIPSLATNMGYVPVGENVINQNGSNILDSRDNLQEDNKNKYNQDTSGRKSTSTEDKLDIVNISNT